MCEGKPQVAYGDGMTFVRECPYCGRFVKADEGIKYKENIAGAVLINEPNATCQKHGRIQMPFLGFY